MAITAFGSYITRSKLRVFFNEDYTDGRLYLYIFGCIWLPVPMIWTMTDISHGRDGSKWDRGIYFLCCPFWRTPGSYTLLRVVDSNGHHTHHLRDMMKTLWSPGHPGEKINNLTIKAKSKLVWTDPQSREYQPLVNQKGADRELEKLLQADVEEP